MAKKPITYAFTRQMLIYKRKIIISVVITFITLALLFLGTSAVLVADLVRGTRPPETGVAPVITPNVAQIVSYKYDGIAYMSMVEVTPEDAEVRVDSSGVNTSVPGTYSVKYIATKNGKSSSYTVKVVIKSDPEVTERIESHIKEKAREWGVNENTSKEALCKLIFEYINSPGKSVNEANYTFVDDSHTNRSDYYEEADKMITNGNGDCYSFFSLSKAFFEYFGIENRDIERTAGVRNDGTHFWSMVNIGSTGHPVWYYFDAIRLIHDFSEGSGCLFNQEQINSYNTSTSKNFYTYDAAGYPKVTGGVINKNWW